MVSSPRVQLLGRVRLWRGARELQVRPGQQQAIVALLALAGGHPVGRQAILDALWGQRPPSTAWNIVQTHIKRLRAELEPDRLTHKESVLLPRVGDGYALAVAPDDVDLHWFVAMARHATLPVLQEALARWSTPVADIAELAEHPVVVEAVQQRWLAIGRYAEAALAAGCPADALGLAQEAAAANPLDESAQARLIRLYRALGRRDEAFATYRAARERLVENLGVDPGPELDTAFRQSLAPSFPSPEPARQLPGDVADFTGRPAEIARMTKLLTRTPANPGTATVIAVVGMGGIGKTSLAVHIGHKLAAEFPDGQLYVRLHGTPFETLGILLHSLGVTGSAMPHDVDERASLFRSRVSGKRMLLVFDDAADEAQVRPLLPGSSTCRVIITSRHRLAALSGIHVVRLGELDHGAALTLLSGQSSASLDEIADLCAGVPLAIRIAGARLSAQPARPASWLAARLRDHRARLDELRAGDLAVRSSLAASYAGISPGAQRTLRRLSLLDAASVAPWTVAALLDGTVRQAETRLDELYDAHLVTSAGADPTGTPRYKLHDLVRLYAFERAETLDTPTVRGEAVARATGAWLYLADLADERLACRYLARRKGSAARWTVEPDCAQHLVSAPDVWFDAEHDNLLTAVEHAARANLRDTAWELADAALGFYEMRDLRDEWTASHERALTVCRGQSDYLGLAVMTRNLAHQASGANVCNVELMRSFASESLRCFAAASHAAGQADAMTMLGEVQSMSGKPRPAAAHFRAAIRLARDGGCALAESVAHNEMAHLYHEQGSEIAAVRRYRTSLRLCAAHGNIRPRYSALRFLGVVEVELGRHAAGEANLREALQLARTMKSPVKQARVLREMAVLQQRTGHEELAAHNLKEALDLSRAAADGVEQAWALRRIAQLDLMRGNAVAARQALTDARNFFEQAGVIYPTALTLDDLGQACAQCGDHDAAREHWERARRLFSQLGNASSVAEIDARAQALSS